MTQSFSEFKAQEEARRERCWDPRLRWQVLQETIAWAEQQLTVRRNDRSARLKEQAEKLALWEQLMGGKSVTPPGAQGDLEEPS